MINQEDLELLREVGSALSESGSLREAVAKLGRDYNDVYCRIRRCGYRIERQLKLVPIHAPTLNSDRTEVA